MIYTIIDYSEDEDYHTCLGEDMSKVKVDLMVNGDIEAEVGFYLQYCKGIVGERVEIESLTPYISIALGVKLL